MNTKAIVAIGVVAILLMDGVWSDWYTTWEKTKTDDHEMVDNFRIKMFTTDVAAA